jgi:hypothetical protein
MSIDTRLAKIPDIKYSRSSVLWALRRNHAHHMSVTITPPFSKSLPLNMKTNESKTREWRANEFRNVMMDESKGS